MAEIPRKCARVSEEMRGLILEWHDWGMTYEDISEGLKVAASTAHKIVKASEEGAPPTHPRGRPKMIPDEHREFIIGLVHEEPTRTLAFLQNACIERYGTKYSLSTICRLLNKFQFSFKRVTMVDEHGETPENMARRAVYANNFAMRLSVNQTMVFYMDEVGFNLSMRRVYGYSPRGTCAVTSVPHIRSKNLTVMALIGLPQGAPPSKVMVCCPTHLICFDSHLCVSLQIWKVLPCAGNTDECSNFFRDVLRTFHERRIARGTIVLDNVRFHHSQKVTQMFPEGGPFELLFLPPYTPDFNPIENMFSKWKNAVCQMRFRNEEELLNAITSAAETITDEDIIGYYSGVTKKCMQYYHDHCQDEAEHE